MKKNKKYLEEMIHQHYSKEEKLQKIEEVAAMRIRQFTYIERAATIRHDLA